jgi:LacI family transcriptional regulator
LVTIADIAREAGVSRSTVSLVLRAHPSIPERTQARVRAAIDRLGYRPNQLAAGLRRRRSGILGLVATDLTYPHYAQIAVGVEEAVEGAGYSLIVTNSHEDVERERRQVETLRGYRADGLLVTPCRNDPAADQHLLSLGAEGYPLVVLYRDLPWLAAPFCGADVYAAATQMIAYLADTCGHRRIALLTSDAPHSTSPRRLAGWRDALAARDLPHGDDLLLVAKGRNTGGEAALSEFLRRRTPFTAVACVNDFMALGALRALHLAGIAVPEAVSVVGMGGFLEWSPPQQPLTTVLEDYREMGRRAGALLLLRLAGDGAEPERILVPTDLLIGETTGPAPVNGRA